MGFFLAILSVGYFLNSFVAGLLGLFSVALLIPTVFDKLASLSSVSAHLTKPVVRWTLVLVLSAAGHVISSASEQSRIKSEFLANRDPILAEANLLKSQGKLDDAYFKLRKYSEVVDSDKELLALVDSLRKEMDRLRAEDRAAAEKLASAKDSRAADDGKTRASSEDSSLNAYAKEYLKTYEMNSFCAGFYSSQLPGASQQSCVAAGNLDPLSQAGMDAGTKCQAWVTDNFYRNGIQPSFPKEMLDYTNARKELYESEYSRGKAAWQRMTPQDAKFCNEVLPRISKIMSRN